MVGGVFGPGPTGQAVKDRLCGGWRDWSRPNRTGCQGQAVWWVAGLVPAQQDRLSRTGCVVGGGFGPGPTGQAVNDRLCGGWWVWSRPNRIGCQGQAVWWVAGLVPAQQDRLSRTGCVVGGGFGPGSTGQAVKERLCDSAGQAVKERLCDSTAQAVKERLCGGWRVWSRLNRTGCVVGGGFGSGPTGQAVWWVVGLIQAQQDRLCDGWWVWSRLNRTGCQGETVWLNRTGCQGEAVWLNRTGCQGEAV